MFEQRQGKERQREMWIMAIDLPVATPDSKLHLGQMAAILPCASRAKESSNSLSVRSLCFSRGTGPGILAPRFVLPERRLGADDPGVVRLVGRLGKDDSGVVGLVWRLLPPDSGVVGPVRRLLPPDSGVVEPVGRLPRLDSGVVGLVGRLLPFDSGVVGPVRRLLPLDSGVVGPVGRPGQAHFEGVGRVPGWRKMVRRPVSGPVRRRRGRVEWRLATRTRFCDKRTVCQTRCPPSPSPRRRRRCRRT